MSALLLPLQRSQPFCVAEQPPPWATARPPAAPSAAQPPLGPLMAQREVAVFLSADPMERRILPVGRALVAITAGSYASLDGETSLALLADDVSPIGSMGVNRLRLQP